jgi:hypothetical protein
MHEHRRCGSRVAAEERVCCEPTHHKPPPAPSSVDGCCSGRMSFVWFWMSSVRFLDEFRLSVGRGGDDNGCYLGACR